MKLFREGSTSAEKVGTKVPDELLATVSKEKEDLYSHLLFSFEERWDPQSNRSRYSVKGTDVLVDMNYWMSNTEQRVKGTQGPPDLKKAERKAMSTAAGRHRTSKPTRRLLSILETFPSDMLVLRKHRTALTSELENWISTLDCYQESRLITNYDMYYDDMARTLSVNNLYLYKRGTVFYLRYADRGHTGTFEETRTSYKTKDSEVIVAVTTKQCSLVTEYTSLTTDRVDMKVSWYEGGDSSTPSSSPRSTTSTKVTVSSSGTSGQHVRDTSTRRNRSSRSKQKTEKEVLQYSYKVFSVPGVFERTSTFTRNRHVRLRAKVCITPFATHSSCSTRLW